MDDLSPLQGDGLDIAKAYAAATGGDRLVPSKRQNGAWEAAAMDGWMGGFGACVVKLSGCFGHGAVKVLSGTAGLWELALAEVPVCC